MSFHDQDVTNKELKEDIRTAKEEILKSLDGIKNKKEASETAEPVEKGEVGNLSLKARSIKDVLISYPEFKTYEQKNIVGL